MKRNLPIIIVIMLGTYLTPLFSSAQELTGKSYVNITKGTVGGTYEPGDILEIRATIAVGNSLTLSRFRYVDTIATNTTYIGGSLKILTNEGLVFRSYTDTGGDDAGMYNSVNGTVRINMGSSTNGTMGGICSDTDPSVSTANGGSIAYNGRPSFYNSTCIMSASYRIQINTGTSLGTTINLTGGAFRYSKSGTDYFKPFNPYPVALSSNIGLCGNSVGSNAVTDNNGTFGSGNTQNRSTAAIVPGYTKFNMNSANVNNPNDGEYSIVNNLSPSGNTNTAAAYSGGHRVFNAWDIVGDHSNAAIPAAGNNPVAPGTNGGYFVVVNASYANGEAFQQPVSGLCSDTYYEFSAWFRNVCSRCACDSVGRGSGNGSFNGPDPAGVLPNLTFEIDGVAYYSTGNISYSGDWVKKGFIFKTAPSQTAFTITIRNNAPGGGGNDWAIDDITFGTCSPQLTFNPSPIASVCAMAEAVELNATVSSYFDNYQYWRWEKSIDGGSNWFNTGVTSQTVPTYNAPNYEYNVDYPPFLASQSDSGDLYRLRIATTFINLGNNSCSYADGTNILTLQVNDCTVLNAEIKNLSAQLRQQKTLLNWRAINTSPSTLFVVEKSTNNRDYREMAFIKAENHTSFQWNDPELVTTATFYRIRIVENNKKTFSNTIMLNKPQGQEFIVNAIRNPFDREIEIEMAAQKEGKLQLILTDLQGRTVHQQQEILPAGVRRVAMRNLEKLPKSMYVLKIQWNEEVFFQKVIK